MSLRTRLVLGLVALAVVALAAADVATYASLRSFLHDRTDSSLNTDHVAIERTLGTITAGSQCRALGVASRDVFVQLRTRDGKHVVCSSRVVDFSHVPESREGASPTPPEEREPPVLPATISLVERPLGTHGPEPSTFFDAVSKGPETHYRVRASLDPELRYMLVVARPLDGVESTLHRLFLIELLVTAAVVAAIVVLGLWLVRLGLRPLEAIAGTAAAIAGGDLSHRVERAEERTEIGRLGLALNAMLSQIEAAFKAREASEARLRRFVADASHELRTPLAAVRAYAELFRRGARDRPVDLERSMAGIERESERMGGLVDDLLLLARLDEGRPLEREPVRLDAIVQEAVETARVVDPDRAIDLEVEPVVVLGDRERLRQVVDNLLANVRSHTPAGTRASVTVRLRDGRAILETSDDGPGMTPEEAERVFERFYRADPSRARASGGAGLGLSIVAAVTRAHEGTASAESAEGRGSTFRLTFPAAEPS